MAGLYIVYIDEYICIDEALKSFHSLNFFERGSTQISLPFGNEIPKWFWFLLHVEQKDITDRGTDNNKGLPKGVQNVK